MSRNETLTAVVRVLRHRLIQAASVVAFVSTLSFVIVQSLPGDVAFRIAAGRYGYDQVSSATADALRAELGLDQPAWRQLLSWWGDVIRFDLGSSLVTAQPVTEELALYLGATLQLTAVALALAFVVGSGLGALSQLWSGRIVDGATTLWIVASRAMPPFLLGLLLIIVFSVQLDWLPATGHGQVTNIVLPAVALAVGLSGLFARVTRDTVAQLQDAAFVGFARTKGLSDGTVLSRHLVRNAGVTLIAYLGAQALVLIEGVLVVELVFSWPGLGHALVHAVFWRDIPMIQGATMVLGLVVVAINLAVDLASLALDPRPRSREAVA
jgi:peptide/nickel transport system permease protein